MFHSGCSFSRVYFRIRNRNTTNSTLFRYSDKIDRIIELYSLILYSLDKEKGAAYFEVHLSLLGWLPISNFKTPPSAISS